MNIWRIHLKADSQAGFDLRQHCLDNGIVGVGWQIDYDDVPVTWEEYFQKANSAYGSTGNSWWTAMNALKNRMQLNDLIWTRDWYGNYFLGRITSEWYYDCSDECTRADIVNVRSCDWQKIGTDEAVPGKIVSSFRAGRTIQSIDDEAALMFSQITYNKNLNTAFYETKSLSGQEIFSLLSPDDCEDALAIYLQVTHDYLVIPSSCKGSTMTYEFELKHRITGKTAVVQVKSGWTRLNRDDYKSLETDVYLFATCGEYVGTTQANIITIDPGIVRTFLFEQTHLLPEKMKLWVEMAR